MCNSTLWPTHCWIEHKNSKYIPIQHFKKSLCRFYLHSVVLNKFLMWYVDELSRTCNSPCRPFFRNITPRHFTWHLYTDQDIAIYQKKLSAPTSGIPKRLRMSKSVKNCGNVIYFYFHKAKKTPGVYVKKFALANGYNDRSIQKAGKPGVSGCLENSAVLPACACDVICDSRKT